MLCTCPQASQLAVPAPSSPGIELPSSAHPWSFKSPTDAPILIKKGILLFNRVRPVRAMWSATPATQCTLCWRFGYPAAGCPKVNPQCRRICGDSSHTARAHPCHQCLVEPTMPKKVDSICPHASPQCINCGADHPANSPSCPKRVEALAEQRARTNKLVRGSPPS